MTGLVRFDIGALRKRAGEAVFARGQAYARDGSVRLLDVGPGRVLAVVSGSEDYRTEVRRQGDGIGGSCSCPAFDDWGICKHMVAVALSANEAGPVAGVDEAGAFPRLRQYLKQQSVDVLVETILDLAADNPELLRQLELAAAIVGDDDKTVRAALLGMLDQATESYGYVGYREASAWVGGVASALDAIAGLVEAGRYAPAFDLLEHAIDRIEEALEEMDDSEGEGVALLHRCRDLHARAAHGAGVDPVLLAAELFAGEMNDEFGVFENAATIYAEALGETGLAEYRRLASERWATLPARSGPAREGETPPLAYSRLVQILDAFAEREGDTEARISLRAKDLSSPSAYLELAEFCVSAGQEEEALRRGEEGVWLFEDHRGAERLMVLTTDLLSKADRHAEAEVLMRKAFESAPSLHLHARLREFGSAASDWAIALLEKRLTGKSKTSWSRPSDLLIRILVQSGDLTRAWVVAKGHEPSIGVKAELVQASEASHPGEAIVFYRQRVDQFAEAGGDTAYAQAAALVERLGRLHGAAEHQAYLSDLKTRYARRRNLMRLLG